MINRTDIIDALTKCAAYDPIHFPKPSDAIIDAWSEHFALYPHITRSDLLNAITTYYRRPSQPVPQPADISTTARDIHRDLSQRWQNSPDEPYEDIEQRERNQRRLRAITTSITDRKAVPE